MKGIGATAAAGVGSNYLGSPVGGAEAIDWSTVGIAATTVVGGPIGLLAYGASIATDDDEVADSLDWNTFTSLYTNQRERNLQLEQTLASFRRDIQLVENKAREEAIFRIYEQGVDSGTESDATAAAETAINEAYDVVLKGILNSFSQRVERFAAIAKALDDGSSTTPSDLHLEQNQNDSEYFSGTTADSTTSMSSALVGDAGTSTWTLFNGDSHTYSNYHQTTTTNSKNTELTLDVGDLEPIGSNSYWAESAYLKKPNHDNFSSVDEPLDVDYGNVPLVRTYLWYDLIKDLEAEHSDMMDEVSAMVDSYFQPAADGEIDLYQAVGPSHLTETASTAKDYQEAAMALRAMGYPMSDQVVTISVPTEDGDGLELTGRLAWTAHQGNTLAVGQTHFAENIPGSIFAAVNLPDGVDSISSGGNTTDTNSTNTTDTDSTSTGPGAEIIELVDEFDIVSAEGADGVSFEDRTLAESDTSQEEINQIYKDNYQANKEATENVHDTATGGGGGWSGLSTTDKGIVAVVAAAILGLVTR
ncbi:hypothetical protein GJ633_02980 [Halorubrum sp. CBA1125]|uniref:hypothetical protein n=1 Tax=Halorubrum sp. CBA1125 TaxID=2668072 RepID=UPI0012E8D85C|nr:hypothetical protein [Halorubrum sp. CBA1125]MUW13735.1 hypothetical protein [Halorubrum sp. CBA1125]